MSYQIVINVIHKIRKDRPLLAYNVKRGVSSSSQHIPRFAWLGLAVALGCQWSKPLSHHIFRSQPYRRCIYIFSFKKFSKSKLFSNYDRLACKNPVKTERWIKALVLLIPEIHKINLTVSLALYKNWLSIEIQISWNLITRGDLLSSKQSCTLNIPYPPKLTPGSNRRRSFGGTCIFVYCLACGRDLKPSGEITNLFKHDT